MERLIRRAQDELAGQARGPWLLQAHLTDRCNLRCLICHLRTQPAPRAEDELTDERWLELVAESTRVGVGRWELVGGGEPLVRRRLVERMIDRIKAGGMEGSLITNGTLIDADLARVMVEAGWDILTVSIDGADRRTHDRLRGQRGAWRRAVRGLRLVARAKARQDRRHPRLRFNTVFSRLNLTELPRVVELGRRFGVAEFAFQPVMVHHQASAELRVDDEDRSELDRVMGQIARRAADEGFDTNAGAYVASPLAEARPDGRRREWEQEGPVEPDGGTAPLPCLMPFYFAVIRPHGEILPCKHMPTSPESVRRQGLGQAWRSPTFTEVRHRLAAGGFADFCRNCPPQEAITDRRIRVGGAEETG